MRLGNRQVDNDLNVPLRKQCIDREGTRNLKLLRASSCALRVNVGDSGNLNAS